MKSLAAIFLLLFTALSLADGPKIWMGFLMKGRPATEPKEEIEKMQAGHIGNFQRLFGQGKLLMAGPLRDPTQMKRGIVVVEASDRDEIAEFFKPDPYLQSGIMTLEIHPWSVQKSAINLQLPDPNAIEENRCVILRSVPGREIPGYLMKQHVEAVQSAIKPSMSGILNDGHGFTQILLFHGTDDARIEAGLHQDPLTRLGWVTAEKMPLWMAKEALR